MPVKLAKKLRSVTPEFHLCIYTKLWMLPHLLANFVITHSFQLNENRKIMPFHHYLCYFLCIFQQD